MKLSGAAREGMLKKIILEKYKEKMDGVNTQFVQALEDAVAVITDKMQKCIDNSYKVYEEASKAYEDLAQVLLSCGTVKQLSAVFPEIAPYLPSQAVCTSLVPMETIERCRRIVTGASR